MTIPPWPERLYRIVSSSPPAEDEFLSNWVIRERDIAARRRPRSAPQDGDALHMWSGVSTYDNAETAREQARRYTLGDFIAILRVEPNTGFRVEQTSRRTDHYTLWGTATALLATVTGVQAA